MTKSWSYIYTLNLKSKRHGTTTQPIFILEITRFWMKHFRQGMYVQKYGKMI